MPLTVAGRSAVKLSKWLLPCLHVRCRRPWNPERVYERTPQGNMPTLSVISSGSSLWMPLDDGFHDSISNVAVLMASIQKDPLLIRIALVPSVHPIIVYTLATKAYKSLKIRKIRKKTRNVREDWNTSMSIYVQLCYAFSEVLNLFVKLLAWIFTMTIRFSSTHGAI